MAIVTFAAIFHLMMLAQFCRAAYDPRLKSNIGLYWGQGGENQKRLSYFCAQSSVDIIPIAFLNVFPAQGNGYPGGKFGNQCSGKTYKGPGGNSSLNALRSNCPTLNEDIPICQGTYSKKILISLGGSSSSYQVMNASDGVAFADFLWGAFGPQTPNWLRRGLPRPFDGPNNQSVEVDGFDFDIEHRSVDNQAGYIAMALRLKTLFKTARKTYLLTGAPQCTVTDPNMGSLIQAVAFDIIWVQFYHTVSCSGRNWTTVNSKYTKGQPELSSGFSYRAWSKFLDGTASKNARLYIGVFSGEAEYLTPIEISNLIDAYSCYARFGGIMIWEATSSDNNAEGPYHSIVKNILTPYDKKPKRLCPTSTSTATTISTKTVHGVIFSNLLFPGGMWLLFLFVYQPALR